MSEFIKFRASQEYQMACKEAAAAAGMTLSAWIMSKLPVATKMAQEPAHVVVATKRKPKPPAADAKKERPFVCLLKGVKQ